MGDIARKNNLTLVDFAACEKVLKKHYDIPEDTFLLVRKFDFGSETNLDNLGNDLASNSVTFAYYDPVTKTRLDLDHCKNVKININMPLKSPNKLKLDLYKELGGQVDIFNPNSGAFTSRCDAIVDSGTGADTSINFRRNNYYNGTATCGEGCTYDGLDEYNFMKCDCSGFNKTKRWHTHSKKKKCLNFQHLMWIL